jgi:hypothetical protein
LLLAALFCQCPPVGRFIHYGGHLQAIELSKICIVFMT